MKSEDKSNRVDLRNPLQVEQVDSNGVNLADINPKGGDKYSPNFWKYLKRNGIPAAIGRVYRDKAGVLWFGYEDAPFMCVTRLMEILCQGVKAQSGAYSNLGNLAEVKDFCPRYLYVGRCAVDPDHQIHFREGKRFLAQTGECLWCGKQHEDNSSSVNH